jgi:hypothetical protein
MPSAFDIDWPQSPARMARRSWMNMSSRAATSEERREYTMIFLCHRLPTMLCGAAATCATPPRASSRIGPRAQRPRGRRPGEAAGPAAFGSGLLLRFALIRLLADRRRSWPPSSRRVSWLRERRGTGAPRDGVPVHIHEHTGAPQSVTARLPDPTSRRSRSWSGSSPGG